MIFAIVINDEIEVIGEIMFADKVEGEIFGHFFNDNEGFGKVIWARKNLARAEAFGGGAMLFDVRNGDGFVTPSMIDEEFGVNPESLIK